ncbi:MAG: hypothetical protein AB4060_04710 [Crocosphaera sp.]
MFKFGRIRKRLLQFMLGFWVVIVIPLIHVNFVKGQNNLDSSELIHSDYKEWYDIGAKLGEWLHNLADKNWFFAGLLY